MWGTAMAASSTSRRTDSTSRLPVRRTAISCSRRRSSTCTSSSSFTTRSAVSIAWRSSTSAGARGLPLQRDDGPEPRRLVGGSGRAGRDDARVPRADLHDRVRERVAVEIGQGIRAEQLEGAGRAQLVPELLEADRRVGPGRGPGAARPSRRTPGSAVPRARRPKRSPTVSAKRPGSTSPATSMRARVSAASAARYWPAACAAAEVRPRPRRRSLERVPVVLGRDHEAGLAGRQAGPHVVGEGGDQDRVVVVELDDVVDGRRIRIRSGHRRSCRRATHVPGRHPPRSSRYPARDSAARPAPPGPRSLAAGRAPPRAVTSSRSLFPAVRLANSPAQRPSNSQYFRRWR